MPDNAFYFHAAYAAAALIYGAYAASIWIRGRHLRAAGERFSSSTRRT